MSASAQELLQDGWVLDDRVFGSQMEGSGSDPPTSTCWNVWLE